MKWRWEEKTRRTPWEDPVVDPLVDRLQTYLGAGNIAQLRNPEAGDPKCLVHVNLTEVAARAIALLAAEGVPMMPVVGRPDSTAEKTPEGAVLVNVARMNALLGVDEHSRVAHVQSGSRWRRLEYLLRRRGLTLGPLPEWLLDRTIFESVATHDRLRPSPRYGQLLDSIIARAVVLPGGAIVRGIVAPRHATGPDLARMVRGTRHAAGLLTEVHLQVWALPEDRTWRAVNFPNWARALDAAHNVVRAAVRPEWWRLSRAGDGSEPIWLHGAFASDLEARRFDDALGGAGTAADAAEARAIESERFPEPSPDPELGETLRPPPAAIVSAPWPVMATLAGRLAGAEIWDIDRIGGAIWCAEAPDEVAIEAIRRGGGAVTLDGCADRVGDWDALTGKVLARLAEMPPVELRHDELPERYVRGGSPF